MDIKQGDDYAASYAQTTGDALNDRDMSFSRTLNKKKRQLSDPVLDLEDADLSPEIQGKVCCDGDVLFSPYQVPGLRNPNTPPIAILEVGNTTPVQVTFDLDMIYYVELPSAPGYQWGYFSGTNFIEYPTGTIVTKDGNTDYLIDLGIMGGLQPVLVLSAELTTSDYGIDKIYFRLKYPPPGVIPIEINGQQMTNVFQDFGMQTLYIRLPRALGINDYVFEMRAESMGQLSSVISTDIIRYVVGPWNGIPY